MSEGYTFEYVKAMGIAAAVTAMNALANARIKESNRALAAETKLKAAEAEIERLNKKLDFADVQVQRLENELRDNEWSDA